MRIAKPSKAKLTLWSTFLLHAVGAIFFLFVCGRLQHTVTQLMKDQPRMQAKEDHLRATIQNDTDLEQLRTRALKAVAMAHNDWHNYLDALATMATVGWSATCVLAATALLVGFAIYHSRRSPATSPEPPRQAAVGQGG